MQNTLNPFITSRRYSVTQRFPEIWLFWESVAWYRLPRKCSAKGLFLVAIFSAYKVKKLYCVKTLFYMLLYKLQYIAKVLNTELFHDANGLYLSRRCCHESFYSIPRWFVFEPCNEHKSFISKLGCFIKLNCVDGISLCRTNLHCKNSGTASCICGNSSRRPEIYRVGSWKIIPTKTFAHRLSGLADREFSKL